MRETPAPKDVFCNEKIIGGSTIFTMGNVRVALCVDSDSDGLHFLIMPKQHREFIHELSPDETKTMQTAIEKIIEYYKSKGLDGSHKLIVLGGAGAGSVIPHFHYHIIPGNADFHSNPKERPKHYTPDELRAAAGEIAKELY